MNGVRTVGGVATAAANDLVLLELVSPGGAFNGAPVFLGGQLYAPAAATTGPAMFPEVQLDPASFAVVWSTSMPSPAGPIGVGLPPGGVVLSLLVDPAVVGSVFRVQGFAVSSTVANGLFAATNAHELSFQ